MITPATLRLTCPDTQRRAPVIIVVDGSNRKLAGLPARVRDQALLVPVTDASDRVDLRNEDVFRVRYLEDDEVHEATIDWSAVFAIVGTNMSGALGGLVGFGSTELVWPTASAESPGFSGAAVFARDSESAQDTARAGLRPAHAT